MCQFTLDIFEFTDFKTKSSFGWVTLIKNIKPPSKNNAAEIINDSSNPYRDKFVSKIPKRSEAIAPDRLVVRLLYAIYCPASSFGERSQARAGTTERIGPVAAERMATNNINKKKLSVNPINNVIIAAKNIPDNTIFLRPILSDRKPEVIAAIIITTRLIVPITRKP